MIDVILTPIYKNMNYQYHECSNCKGKIYFEEDICIPFHFEENIKYCPFCGEKVIRYANPKYVELPNWDWLEKFDKILNETNRKIEYEIFCKMNNEEKRELIDKADFGKNYFGSSLFWYDNAATCAIVKEVALRKPHYSYINKLKKEFEKNSQ